jgi:cytoskeletal protein RodZ
MPFSTPMLDEGADGAPEPVGQWLKARREARGLSLDEVAEATKIQPETIKAIEAGTILETSPPAYARGFVRSYAEYLEADTEQIMDAFDRLCGPAQARLYLQGVGTMAHKDFRPSRRSRVRRRSPLRPFVLAALVLVALALALYVYVNFDKWFGPADDVPSTPAGDGPRGAITPEAPDTPVGGGDTPATARFQLTVIADENAWVKAEVDGTVAFNSVLAKGKSKPFPAAQRVRIELRDASHVRVLKDGKPIAEDLGSGAATITYGEDLFEVTHDESE